MSRLIVALDFPDISQAISLVDALSDFELIFKVGYEAYYRYGHELLAYLAERRLDIFLDLKFHDIPRTAAAAMRAVMRPGIRIITVHAGGGEEMMRHVVEVAAEAARELDLPVPLIFGVTILTSIAELSLPELGFTGGMGENVVRLAALARNAGCAGVVCSPHEASDLKAFFGHDFQALCPGIRPRGSASEDQQRVATPSQAIAAGADYLVVGRPITGAVDPAGVVRAILEEMRSAIPG